MTSSRPWNALRFVVFAAALGACADDPAPITPADAQPALDATAAADAATSDPDASAPDASAEDARASDPDAGLLDSGTVTSTGDPSVVELEIGAVTITNGQSMPVNFTLPADVVSFMILIDGPDDTAFVTYELTGPSGTLVSSDASMVTPIERLFLGPYAAQFKSPNRVVQDLGFAAASFPNNPGVTITGGDYVLVVGGMKLTGMGVPHTGDVSVKVLYRRAIPAASRVDLHLYFTGASGITSTSAPSSALMSGAIDALRGIYAQANVEIGAVSYHPADARFRTITGFDGSGRDLEELFEQSAGQGRGLHFFFVDRFMGGFPGATVAGVSGGLPGPPGSAGTVAAGVAVALSTANGDPGILAHVMAHEGGHWLGLFHTSEITGTNDQHPETPEGMTGQNHLMYPAVGGGTTISASQAQVMRLHGELVAR